MCIRDSVRTDELKGKRVGIIGDSYVKNHKEPVKNTWHYKFAEKQMCIRDRFYTGFGKIICGIFRKHGQYSTDILVVYHTYDNV